MVEMVSDKDVAICRDIVLRANKFILKEVELAFSDTADRISADVTVKIVLLESALGALEMLTGRKYAKIVRLEGVK